ncbi:MAG: hypothetical protein AB7E81_23275 [Hyphomicrobiaceae bacterium]|jgi:hypothetical protein
MLLLLIDDQGEVWRGESRKLREAFDSPFSGGEFVEYAIKNLGFIALNVYGTSCQVRLRPKFLGELAREALRKWLCDRRVERVVLSHFDSSWVDELVVPRALDARLDALRPAQTGRTGDFLLRPLSMENAPRMVLSNSRVPVADLMKSWPALLHEYEATNLLRLLRLAFNEKFVIVQRPSGGERVLFSEFGDQMYFRYDTWRECAIGAPISEQPDRAYGRWVNESYNVAMGSTKPSYEAVDAILHWPDIGRARRRYRRILFPFQENQSGQLLFCGSLDDTNVDLRISPPRA